MKRKRTARRSGKPLLRDFIVPYHGALTADVCRSIIATFERDPRRQPSRTAAGVAEAGRSGTIVAMTDDPEWAELKETVRTKTVECLHEYATRFSSIEFILKREEILLSPPVVEKLDPGQGFAWHIDSGPIGTARRFLSALTYLNNVDEGGFTEFPLQNTMLKPRQGMIVLFPPYWLFPHRGIPPTQEIKYKMTSYFMVPERETFLL